MPVLLLLLPRYRGILCLQQDGALLRAADRAINQYMYLPRTEREIRRLMDDRSTAGHRFATDAQWRNPPFPAKVVAAGQADRRVAVRGA
jgi:hypothetical protein